MVSTKNPPFELERDSFILNKRFRLLKRLGKGGMGEVFQAEDLKLKRTVAIKRISTHTDFGPFPKARFLREAQTASQLEHPNICTIYEIYEEDDCNYIVMQYIDGFTLDQIMKMELLTIEKVLDVSIQVCNGMIEANRKGIIHRDLKPSNIIVDQRGDVKILDFGLAKVRDRFVSKKSDKERRTITEKGFVMGTAAYMSPEQARGQLLDAATDIFSFGCVLFEMLEGIDPFRDDDQVTILYNILNKKVKLSTRIPENLIKVVSKSLEKEKEKRYADFSQLKKALADFKSQLEGLGKKKSEESKSRYMELKREDSRNGGKIQGDDEENLGAIVRRLKKLSMTTNASRLIKKRSLIPILIFLVLISVTTVYFVVVGNRVAEVGIEGGHSPLFIFLYNFENHTDERDLSDKVNYLLFESLNQFKAFKVMNADTVRSVDENIVSKNFYENELNVKFELKGEIFRINDMINIDAELVPLGRTGKVYSMTIPGLQDKNSLLIHQIDTLTLQIYGKIFPDHRNDLKFKKISGIFGTSWERFSHFYEGARFYKKLEIKKAEEYFLKSLDLLATKINLADLYIFKGSRLDAVKLIDQISPQVDLLTDALRLRVQAINSRLSFNFKEEIRHLQKLKDEFPFSKEFLFELGEAYFHHGNAKKAISYYEQALKLSKHYSKAINHLGYCYSHIGNHRKAIELFEEYRDLDHSANSFDSLGDGYFYAGDYISAEACKKAALSMDEKGIYFAYRILANIYIIKAKFEEAEKCIRRFAELADFRYSLNANSLATCAYIAYLNRAYKNALSLANRSLEIFDDDDINRNAAQAHWVRGITLLALGSKDKAKQDLYWLWKFVNRYNLSVDNYLTPFKYYTHLWALVLEREQSIEKANDVFKNLILMKTQLSYRATYYHYQFFHTEYAKFLLRNKKYKVALDEIDKCLDFNTNYIPALWIKAEILEKLDDSTGYSIYQKIAENYGEASEKNYFRSLLKEKMYGEKSRKE